MSEGMAPRVWAVVPAAGVGRRMSSHVPKQYQPLLGRPVITWSLETLLAASRVEAAAVAVSPEDGWWETTEYPDGKPTYRVTGGRERADSVLAALRFLTHELAGEGDWVLVHDAVRPCLLPTAVENLLDAGLTADGQGALLAIPVRDTLKCGSPDGTVARTASRDHLWQAQTPQLFPLGTLLQALEAARGRGEPVTDESQAMERAGYAPRLVDGDAGNLKITRPEDLLLAEGILRARRETRG